MVQGLANRFIADRFELSATAVHRHRKNHLPPALVRDAEHAAADLIADLRGLREKVQEVIDGAETRASLLAGVDRAIKLVEAIARMRGIGVQGQTGGGGDTHVTNIQVIYGGDKDPVPTEGEIVESTGPE